MGNNSTKLRMNIKSGDPISKVDADALQYMNDVLKNLEVINGRLIIAGARWVIVCGSQIYGKPGLFKTPVLMGVKRKDANSDWEEMTVAEMVANKDKFVRLSDVAEDTDLFALRLTWEVNRHRPSDWGDPA